MWKFIKPAIFRFDAEKIHELSLRIIRDFGAHRPQVLHLLSGVDFGRASIPFLNKNLNGPVGLAAGFDKNALIVPYLAHLGFSSAEIGSVTLRPQAGNPKPRLFRGSERLFNFMGFNNDGAEAIAGRMAGYKIPDNFAVGVNIGLNKETPHADAPGEYAQVFRILESYGDYFVVNVSSPNTAGLRELQAVGTIEKIFASMKARPSSKPIFLKLAPELDDETLAEFFRRAGDLGIDGFVLTNTLKGEREGKTGGWSGAPLTEISRSHLQFARSRTTLPIISVGGIMTVDEALQRKRAGANLVQIYTGWVFRGPTFPSRIAAAWEQA